MGRNDVLDYLEKHPGEKYGPTEIAEKLGKTRSTIQPQLRTLFKREMIERDANGKYWVPIKRTNDHASRVASGMLALIKKGRYRTENGLWQDPKHIPNALMHLKKEYSDIYGKCKKMMGSENYYLNTRSQLEKEIAALTTKLNEGMKCLKHKGCVDCGGYLTVEEQKEINELADYFR